jgi:hypothetical protein
MAQRADGSRAAVPCALRALQRPRRVTTAMATEPDCSIGVVRPLRNVRIQTFQGAHMKKIIAGAALLTAFAMPALAADYYIVQDSGTKKCTVVDKRPTVKTTTVVGGDKVYTTREEATSAMKTVKVCQSM